MANPHEPLIRMILDLYSEKTGLPVAFVYKHEILWQTSNEFCSPYCHEIHKWNRKRCETDHLVMSELKEGKLTLCYAGLWNYILPIKDDSGKTIATLFTGQRRLKDKDIESSNVLSEFRKTYCVSEEQYLIFVKCFNNTPKIEEFDFNYLKALRIVAELLYQIIITQDNEKRKILNLVHQFLLPIQSIVANSSNLAKKLEKSDGGIEEQAVNVKDQVIILGKIADNMRSSLSGSDTESYAFKMGNIIDVLKPNIEILKWYASTKNVQIRDPEFHGYPLTHLNMSSLQLNRAFFNILHNAVKYSYFSLEDNNRFIDIKIINLKDCCKIEISNYGIGILEEEFEKIFEGGYRGKLSGDRERTGCGIGLNEARKIIEKHGGKITVNSQCMGIDKLNDPYKTIIQVTLPR